jgi:hypothetical protein
MVGTSVLAYTLTHFANLNNIMKALTLLILNVGLGCAHCAYLPLDFSPLTLTH